MANELPETLMAALLFALTLLAGPDAAPQFRHGAALAVLPQGAAVTLDLECLPHGTAQASTLVWQVVRGAGERIGRGRVGLGQRATVPLGELPPRLHVVAVASGWSLARPALEGAPWAVVCHAGAVCHTVGAAAFYLYQPAGAEGTVSIGASVTSEGCRVILSDGETILADEEGDFDEPKVFTLPAGDAARVVRLELAKPIQAGLHLDDVETILGGGLAPYLATTPEAARQLGERWAAQPAVAPTPPAPRPPVSPIGPPAGLAPVLPAAAEPAPPLSRLPLTYVLDYASNHLDRADYPDRIATAPPHLLHLGKDVPMSHNWGPIRGLGGENQAGGRGEAITRLTPDETTARIAALREMVDRLHGAGVPFVVPYICLMTLGGDLDRRTGFWEFYDHWDDYAAFGLGPRPAADPADWLQRTPAGEPVRFYSYTGAFYPPYEPNQRYAASVNSPDWRRWEESLVRLLARCGYDGAFVDNGGSERSCDPRSQAMFQEWLAQRWTAAQRRELFGLEPGEALALEPNAKGLAGAEMRRFWMDSVRTHLAALGAAGTEALGRRFRLFPNSAHSLPNVRHVFRDCDWAMFELSSGDFGTNAGRVVQPIVEDVSLTHLNRHLFEYLYMPSAGYRVRAMLLTQGGYPRIVPEWDLNPAAAELGQAEAAAFSGGGGYMLRQVERGLGPALLKYRRFFDAQASLYSGLVPDGRVGVLAFADEQLFGPRTHESAARATLDWLTEQGIPTRLLTEDRCTPTDLAGLAAVIVPALGHLSADQAAGLRTVADAGLGTGADAGRLIFVGEPPALDETDRPAPHGRDLAALPRAATVADLDGLATALPVADLRLADLTGAARELRLATWRDPATGRRVLHLVNYNVQLGRGADEVDPTGPLTLKLPATWPAGTLRWASPDGDGGALTPNPDGTITVPPVRIYTVVELVPAG